MSGARTDTTESAVGRGGRRKDRKRNPGDSGRGEAEPVGGLVEKHITGKLINMKMMRPRMRRVIKMCEYSQ